MILPSSDAVTTYRAIFLSDLHLGAKSSRTADILDFLRRHEAEHIYLVGDIIDGWQLRKNWNWSQATNDVIQKLLRKVRKGSQVHYVPGNHDQFAREYLGVQFGGITVSRTATHTTADGRTLFVLHGDEFDGVVTYARWLALLGSNAYEVSVVLNHWLNAIRLRLGKPYWSLSGYLKHRVKNAMKFMEQFEHAVIAEARRRGADGVVCGHIHRAAHKIVDGISYYNTGDWVESCTAIVEHFDGRIELLHWTPADRYPVRSIPKRTLRSAVHNTR